MKQKNVGHAMWFSLGLVACLGGFLSAEFSGTLAAQAKAPFCANDLGFKCVAQPGAGFVCMTYTCVNAPDGTILKSACSPGTLSCSFLGADCELDCS